MQMLNKDDLLPQILTSFMPPALAPLSPNSSLLGLIFKKWSSSKMAQIAENHAKVFEANARAFHSQLGMMKAIQTYSSDLEMYFAEQKHRHAQITHEEIMWQLLQAQEHAKTRQVNAEAEKSELELEQFKRAMSE